MGCVLVSGGTGFIGSHTCVELINAGFDVAVFDNLSNSKESVLDRIEKICGTRPRFYEVDMLDSAALDRVFESEDVESVIHFAGLKAVAESVEAPWEYYHNNVTGTLVLLDAMRRNGCKTIVFSSSATIYAGNNIPYREDMSPGTPASPYGWSKWFIERILTDVAVSDKAFNAVLLRYFNPIGAHPSGLIGEDPQGIPNNLMPYITQVAVGKRDMLHVFGDDYPTPDGTCRRDFIHVVDLARGHVAALRWSAGKTGCIPFNLGSGSPTSVYELIAAFEAASGVKIPFVVDQRREGDLPEFFADPTRAREELDWETTLTIDDMCRDSWNWQEHNPNGYEE